MGFGALLHALPSNNGSDRHGEIGRKVATKMQIKASERVLPGHGHACTSENGPESLRITNREKYSSRADARKCSFMTLATF